LGDDLEIDALRRAFRWADLGIDAMFGTGLSRPLDAPTAILAGTFRSVRTLAVDIPWGIDGATGEVMGKAVSAEETITFAALKPGLLFEPGRTHAGRVTVADIGIDVQPGRRNLFVAERVDLFVPQREQNSHK